MSLKYPLDPQKAIESLGGSESIYYSMLSKFEPMSLISSLEDMAKAVNEKDPAQVKGKAHSLKGASGYIGAGGVHYSCYHIQEMFLQEDYETMMAYYPALVEEAIKFRIYSRKIVAKFKSKIKKSV